MSIPWEKLSMSPMLPARARPKMAQGEPAPRRRLDRAQVLEAARSLADTHGVEALSIKQLADTLGIKPPSVYAHFAGLPELRRGLALWGFRALEQQLSTAVVGLTGRDALLALGHAYLDFIRSSPGLYAATVPSPDVDDTELRSAANAWIAVFYRVLATLSLPTDDAIHALSGLRSIVHGFGMLEMQGAFRTMVDRDLSFRQVLQTFVGAIGQVPDPAAPKPAERKPPVGRKPPLAAKPPAASTRPAAGRQPVARQQAQARAPRPTSRKTGSQGA